PADEYAVRRDLAELRRWLEAEPRSIACASISLAKLFWDALENSEFLDDLFEQEREADGDEQALREVYESVTEILHHGKTLAERIQEELEQCDPRTAVFLYRAGALYPAYRTSALL